LLKTLESTWLARVFPLAAFKIIAKRCWPEDLPRLESNDLFNKPVPSGRLSPLASLCLGLRLRDGVAGAVSHSGFYAGEIYVSTNSGISYSFPSVFPFLPSIFLPSLRS